MKVRIETVDLRQASDIYGERRANMAMASSMNKVIGQARNVMIDAVLKEYTVRRKAVRERSILFRKALPQKLEAWLIGVGERIPVGAFARPTQGKVGTSVTIKRGKRTLYPSAFRARMPSGYMSVWWRSKTKKMKSKPSRAAIFEPLGPSVAHMYIDEDVQKDLVRYVQRELPVDFSVRLLEGARRKIRSAQKRIIP